MTEGALALTWLRDSSTTSDPVSVVAGLPGRLWVANLAGVIDAATPGWWAFVGKRETSITWFEGIHPDELAECREAFSAASAGAHARIVYRRQAADGLYNWIEDEFQPFAGLPDATRVVGSTSDLAAARVAEARAADLALQVQQREVQLRLLLSAEAAGGESQAALADLVQTSLAQHSRRHARPLHSIEDLGLLRVTVSAEALQQVLTCLLATTEDHTPPGVPIDIQVFREGDTVGVRMRDAGQPHLAELDDRVGSPRDHHAGLDFAVCEHLIEAQGGQFWVTPGQGGGREFGFRLPLRRE